MSDWRVEFGGLSDREVAELERAVERQREVGGSVDVGVLAEELGIGLE